MLKVKLTRTGKKNQAHFRIVVNEARDKRDGSYVENLGHYAPAAIPKLLEINIERYDYWISKGAQPTDTVAALVKRFKTGNPFPPKKGKKLNKKAKARLEAEKEAKAAETDKPAEPAEEKAAKPVEEAKETKVEEVEKKEEKVVEEKEVEKKEEKKA